MNKPDSHPFAYVDLTDPNLDLKTLDDATRALAEKKREAVKDVFPFDCIDVKHLLDEFYEEGRIHLCDMIRGDQCSLDEYENGELKVKCLKCVREKLGQLVHTHRPDEMLHLLDNLFCINVLVTIEGIDVKLVPADGYIRSIPPENN